MKTFLAALVIGVGVLATGPSFNTAFADPKKVDRNSEEHRRWQEEFRRRHGIEDKKPAQRPPAQTPPAQRPPAQTPPAQTPPATR